MSDSTRIDVSQTFLTRARERDAREAKLVEELRKSRDVVSRLKSQNTLLSIALLIVSVCLFLLCFFALFTSMRIIP